MVAANIAPVVSHPRTFILRVLTHLPMILRLFMMRMTSSIRNSVEHPCTIPANASAFIGLIAEEVQAHGEKRKHSDSDVDFFRL